MGMLDTNPKTKNDRHREFLFNAYSINLSRCVRELEDVFGCPLCFQIFDRASLDSGELTLEHIIPESIGGKLITLLCKNCNNTQGSKIDAHLVKQFEAEDKLSGLSNKPLRSRLSVGEHRIAIDLYLSADNPEQIIISGLPEHSNPMSLKLVMNTFESGMGEFQLGGSLGYNPEHSKAAVLKIAYLLMFHHFGYSYVLQENVQQIRKQILNPDQELIPPEAAVEIAQSPRDSFRISIINSPNELRSFLVLLDLSSAQKRHVGVILPGADDSGNSIYSRLRNLREELVDMQISTKTVENRFNILSDPTNVGLLSVLWRKACNY